MSISLTERASAPRGHFVLKVYSSGILVDQMDDHNLIVDLSKQVHAKLLGGSFTGNNVSTIGFGTNGTTEVVGNTALTGSFTKAVDAITYPASNQVQFAFSLSNAEANGLGILEFGLLTASGTLFARKTRTTSLNKESDISLSGTWTISY